MPKSYAITTEKMETNWTSSFMTRLPAIEIFPRHPQICSLLPGKKVRVQNTLFCLFLLESKKSGSCSIENRKEHQR